ncbi:helicase-associated domain-containing protein [Lysobacter korlensis]|uniref:Helicase-associated domain-containing protein n=1 Tax=Lysobacter korlensis TaxID=553636 RepID=A0ABV6RV84_9GAMM
MPASSTSALSLAARLRATDDTELARLLDARRIRDKRIDDFFDLADALLDRASIQHALSRLDRHTLAILAAAPRPTPLDDIVRRARVSDPEDPLRIARALALLDLDDERIVSVYDAVTEQLEAWPSLGLPSPAELLDEPPPPALEAVADADSRFLDRAASERAFATTTAVGELVTEVSVQPARELAKGGLALPDSKRLAVAMGAELHAVPAMLEIAERSQLVERGPGGWNAAESATQWLELPIVERWLRLAGSWLATLPAEIRALLAERPHAAWGEGLAQYLGWLFPAGGDWMRDRLTRYTRDAELLGITAQGTTTGPGAALLAEGVDAARARILPLLPPEVDRVYVQHDLTIVAPGPLAAAADARLRRIADVESRTLASSYRVTQSSLTRGLAAGETRESIREFLTELSLTGIPQPLEYLLVETANRYGALRVGPADRDSVDALPGAKSRIRSNDATLIGAISVDQNLSALALEPDGDRRLVSRFEPDVVFWALTEARYPIVAENEHGEIVPVERPRPPATPPAPEPNGIADLLARVRRSGSSAPEEAGAAWIVRQLEVAIRNRTGVMVTVRMPDGSQVTYALEPAAVAGGRLRSRDRRADIERTLPLSHIVAVEPLG